MTQTIPASFHCSCGHCLTQVGFKRELIKEVRLFVADAQDFRQDWEANGPMVPGLDPMDAVDRLKKFQLMFEVQLLLLGLLSLELLLPGLLSLQLLQPILGLCDMVHCVVGLTTCRS